MTKWELVLYGEIDRNTFDTEKKAKSEGERHARISNCDYKINEIDYDDEEKL